MLGRVLWQSPPRPSSSAQIWASWLVTQMAGKLTGSRTLSYAVCRHRLRGCLQQRAARSARLAQPKCDSGFPELVSIRPHSRHGQATTTRTATSVAIAPAVWFDFRTLAAVVLCAFARCSVFTTKSDVIFGL